MSGLHDRSHAYIADALTKKEVAITSQPTYGFSSNYVNTRAIGDIIIVDYYIKISIAKSSGNQIATFDIPGNFAINYFNADCRLAANTKQLQCNRSMSVGTECSGQLIGLVS